ncbi:MAG TPA: hypothetical protein VNJ52_11260 [Patescibacteria group bacterium]|nr:hypothetical protein [Patescibacteria group bacterium]
MAKFATRFPILTATLVLFGVSLAWGQQGQTQSQTSSGQQPGQPPSSQNTASPQQPLSPEQTGAQQSANQPNQNEPVSSGASSLTGAEQFTLSRIGAGHNYIIPSFQFAQSVATSGTGPFGTAQVDPISTLSGVFAFHHLWSRYEMTAQYAGSGFLYYHEPSLDTSAHEFSLSQHVSGRRSSFLLSDVVTYLPESSFGYSRFSGFNNYGSAGYGYGGLFGVNGSNLDTTFLPGQSLLTSPSSQVGNTVVGEYDYLLNPLSSLTLTGSYILLRFPSSGYIGTEEAIFQIGYNHTFTRKNSLGVAYQGGIFRFGSFGGDFTNHAVTLNFRRTISRRLGLQLSAGPQFILFSNNSAAPGQTTQISWQASGRLSYQLERFLVGLSYLHYTSSGSGVYRGAKTDNVGMNFSAPLSRAWTFDANLGYAYNTNLQGANPSGTAASYNSWYGTVNLHRTLNRWLSIFLSYNVQQQLTPTATCIGSTCGTFYTQQYFSFGLNWHPVLPGVE